MLPPAPAPPAPTTANLGLSRSSSTPVVGADADAPAWHRARSTRSRDARGRARARPSVPSDENEPAAERPRVLPAGSAAAGRRRRRAAGPPPETKGLSPDLLLSTQAWSHSTPMDPVWHRQHQRRRRLPAENGGPKDESLDFLSSRSGSEPRQQPSSAPSTPASKPRRRVRKAPAAPAPPPEVDLDEELGTPAHLLEVPPSTPPARMRSKAAKAPKAPHVHTTGDAEPPADGDRPRRRRPSRTAVARRIEAVEMPDTPVDLATLATLVVGDDDSDERRVEQERDALWLSEERERHEAYKAAALAQLKANGGVPPAPRAEPAAAASSSSGSDEFFDSETDESASLAGGEPAVAALGPESAGSPPADAEEQDEFQDVDDSLPADEAPRMSAAQHTQLEEERRQLQAELARMRRQNEEDERLSQQRRAEAERERLERARAEWQRQQQEFVERKRRVLREQAEAERKRREEAERKAEEARLAEQLRLEREALERAARAEQERRKRAEREEEERRQQALRAAQERREREEAERIERERAEREAIERERRAQAALEERERREAAERAERERQAAEAAAAAAAAERRAAEERAEAERQRLEAEMRAEAQAAMEARRAAEQAAEAERLALERELIAEAERIEQQRRAFERELEEQERRRQEERERAARQEAERIERGRREAEERAEAERRAAVERAEAERRAAEEAAAAERRAAEEREREAEERELAAQREMERRERERERQEREAQLARERAEQAARLNAERREAAARQAEEDRARMEQQRVMIEEKALKRARRETDDEDRLSRTSGRRREEGGDESSGEEDEVESTPGASDDNRSSMVSDTGISQVLQKLHIVSRASQPTGVRGILSKPQEGAEPPSDSAERAPAAGAPVKSGSLRFAAPQPPRAEEEPLAAQPHPDLPAFAAAVATGVPRICAAPTVRVRRAPWELPWARSTDPNEKRQIPPVGPYSNENVRYMPGFTVHGLADPARAARASGHYVWSPRPGSDEEQAEPQPERVSDAATRMWVEGGAPIAMRVLSLLDMADIKNMAQTCRAIRSIIYDTCREPLLEYLLGGAIGYATWHGHEVPEDPLPLTLGDAEAFLMYFAVERELRTAADVYLGSGHRLDRRVPRLARASTRAFSKVLARVRLQGIAAHATGAKAAGAAAVRPRGGVRSPYDPERAALFRIWAPESESSSWIFSNELQRTERELFIAGIWRYLCRGDVVVNCAKHAHGNEGRYIFDGDGFMPLSVKYDALGHLPPYVNMLHHPPLFYDGVVRNGAAGAVVYMDLLPLRTFIVRNLQLVHDHVEHMGARHRYKIAKWLYRATFEINVAAMPELAEVHPRWSGVVVVATEGTTEHAKELVNRCVSPREPEAFGQQLLSIVLNHQGEVANVPPADPLFSDDGTRTSFNYPWLLQYDRAQPGIVWLSPL